VRFGPVAHAVEVFLREFAATGGV